MAEPAFHVVLLNPQIPNNTGNIGRTAAATGCRLHVIHPLGFDMSEKARRRAGLDYWHLVDCREHASWDAFLAQERPARLWLFTTQTDRPYWKARFRRGDYLLFGQENWRRLAGGARVGRNDASARTPASRCRWSRAPGASTSRRRSAPPSTRGFDSSRMAGLPVPRRDR